VKGYTICSLSANFLGDFMIFVGVFFLIVILVLGVLRVLYFYSRNTFTMDVNIFLSSLVFNRPCLLNFFSF